MAGDNEDFKSTDERIGDMFKSAIAPLPDPDQAFINRALLARSGSPTTIATPTNESAGSPSNPAGAPGASVSPAIRNVPEPWY